MMRQVEADVRTHQMRVRVILNKRAPPSSLNTVVTTPVCVFVAVTDTPGIKAPLASAAVPLILD